MRGTPPELKIKVVMSKVVFKGLPSFANAANPQQKKYKISETSGKDSVVTKCFVCDGSGLEMGRRPNAQVRKTWKKKMENGPQACNGRKMAAEMEKMAQIPSFPFWWPFFGHFRPAAILHFLGRCERILHFMGREVQGR